MHSVTVRYPKDLVAHVRRAARQRAVAQAQVWREIAAIRSYRHETDNEQLETVLSLVIQTLCTTRRADWAYRRVLD